MEKEIQFIQWEARVFGFGYGSGELPIMKVVKVFFESLEESRIYDHEVLEKKLGETVTWFLINALARADVIEYGTSPRHGWLTSCGEFVRDFIREKSAEELHNIIFSEHDSICECDGEIKDKGHEDCGKNPMVNEKYANDLKYKK